LVRGQRCPLLGRVTMDLMMIDVSKIDTCKWATSLLMGRDANEEVSCAELADRGDTITWEIITALAAASDAFTLIGHVPDHLQRIERSRDIGVAEKNCSSTYWPNSRSCQRTSII